MVVYTRKVYGFNSSCFPYHEIVSYEPQNDYFRNENITNLEYLRDLPWKDHRGRYHSFAYEDNDIDFTVLWR